MVPAKSSVGEENVDAAGVSGGPIGWGRSPTNRGLPRGIKCVGLFASAVLQACDGDMMGKLLIVEVVHRVGEDVDLIVEVLPINRHLLH